MILCWRGPLTFLGLHDQPVGECEEGTTEEAQRDCGVRSELQVGTSGLFKD